jgi:formamidopyrimidine-DNA glycosylase
MPELPEVETVVRQLDQVLPGRVIDKVEVLREKSAQTDLQDAVGMKIVKVRRKQKLIVVELEKIEDIGNDKLNLVVHLRMTGQLVWRKGKPKLKTRNFKLKTVESAKADNLDSPGQVQGGHPSVDWVQELPSKHTRIVVTFIDGSVLYFNDQRVFGWMKLIQSSELRTQISKMPPDVVDAEFTIKYLQGILKKTTSPIKVVILDQQKMGGMGNIYACDSLWLAGIKPARKASSLRSNEVRALHKAMVQVLHRAIDLGGSSYSDFVDTAGLGGKYQDEFLVYSREGEGCRRDDCDGVIEKIKLGGRGTYWCGGCQK